MLVGYARVSTSGQDLAAQCDGLAALGVDDQHVHFEHGLSGTTRARPGLCEALAACRAGNVLVVTKLDRLAGSLWDATDIADGLTQKGVALTPRGSGLRPHRRGSLIDAPSTARTPPPSGESPLPSATTSSLWASSSAVKLWRPNRQRGLPTWATSRPRQLIARIGPGSPPRWRP